MPETLHHDLVRAGQVARETALRRAANGVAFAAFGENELEDADLERMVQAVPALVAPGLVGRAFYFVPLALSEPAGRGGIRSAQDETFVAPVYTTALADEAICHRNVTLGPPGPPEGVFISTRLLGDRFALAFEFFINVGHAFVEAAGVPESFSALAWSQAVADVRGETSQDSWESRNLALGDKTSARPAIDEKAKTSFLESAFADALAIYQLSLAVDFDYSELREREYPLLAPQALAERLRHVAKLFPPNPEYTFAIKYRRRA